jgi:predicted MFS family arabinose efflux permease
MAIAQSTRIVLKVGTAQTLAWASTYYLPAILAVPIARDLDVETATVFAAFSVGLVISAIFGPYAGRLIDRTGGGSILALANLILAFGLALLGLATGVVGLFVAWIFLGIGMAAGLYEAAFAYLVKLYGRNARNAITGITLIAGFASTIGWPLTTMLEAAVGWRYTCFIWAILQLLVALPLNLLLPKVVEASADAKSELASMYSVGSSTASTKQAVLLAIVFAITWFISTAMAAHLPTLLKAAGATVALAVTAGALIGPAQVAGRLLEFGILRRLHPLLSARLAALCHPMGAVILVIAGAPAVIVFALMHGAGNGILTIAKGTLPLALFGPQGYGERQGLLMVPARIAQALAPWLFGLLMSYLGVEVLWVSAGLGLSALLALLFL